MVKPQHTFRLDPAVKKMMDELLADPPPIVIDGFRGAPRNRTELVENLVKAAAQMRKPGKKKKKATA